MNFEQLIKFAVDQNASDLHFQTGASPLLRINGQIRNVESPPLTEDVLKQFILSLRPSIKPEELDEKIYQGLDFSYFVPGLSRFRVQRLQPPRHAGDGHAGDQAEDPDDRGAATAAGDQGHRPVASRDDPA